MIKIVSKRKVKSDWQALGVATSAHSGGLTVMLPVIVKTPDEDSCDAACAAIDALELLRQLYLDPKIKLITYATQAQQILLKAKLI